MHRKIILIVALLSLFSLSLLNNSLRAQAQSSTTAKGQEQWQIELIDQIEGGATSIAVRDQYAYISAGPRLMVLDISDYSHPVMVSLSEMMPGVLGPIILDGNYAYTTGSGVLVIDVTDPRNPKLSCHYPLDGWLRLMDIEDQYAYVYNSVTGIWVIDIHDPHHLSETGFIPVGEFESGIDVRQPYAYLATSDGLHILDISDPDEITQVGFFRPSSSIILQNVKVAPSPTDPSRLYAYANGIRDLWVIDVSDPTAPYQAGYYNSTEIFEDLLVEGNRLYTYDNSLSDPDQDHLRILDITNPSSPVQLGAYRIGNWIYSTASSQPILFIVTDTGLSIFDSTDPSALVDAGFLDLPNPAYGLAQFEDRLYVGNSGSELQIWDISNTASPVLLGQCNIHGTGYELAITRPVSQPERTLVFVATHENGLRIVDVTDPALPVETAFFDPVDYITDVAVAIPQDHPEKTYIYLTADHEGLIVLDVTDPADPIKLGSKSVEYPTGVAVTQDGESGKTYAYLAASNSGLFILDATDPAAILQVATFQGRGSVYEVEIVNERAYLVERSGYWDGNEHVGGLEILDISSPEAPRLSGYFTSSEVPTHIFIRGEYAYFTNGYSGITVLKIDSQGIPTVVGSHATVDFPRSITVLGDTIYSTEGNGGISIFWQTPKTVVQILPESSQVMSTDDGTVYRFLPGSFPGIVTAVHTPRYPSNVPNTGELGSTDRFFEFEAVKEDGSVILPNLPYTIEISYKEDEINGLSEDLLALYYWSGQEWVKEPTSQADPIANRITAQADHFWLWAVLAGSEEKVDLLQLFMPLVLFP